MKNINKIDKFISSVKQVTHLLGSMYPNGDYIFGGYLTILDSVTGQIVTLVKIKDLDVKKYSFLIKDSIDKAESLFQKRENNNMIASFDIGPESTGAIFYEDYILSFSGYSNLINELVVLQALVFSQQESQKHIFEQSIVGEIYQKRPKKEGLSDFVDFRKKIYKYK